MKRRFIFGLLIGSLAGFVAGVSVALMGLSGSTSWGSRWSDWPQQRAPPHHVSDLPLRAILSRRNFLSNHASLLQAWPTRPRRSSERGSYLQDLAVNQARLAKLAAAQGETEKAITLLGEAMSHLRDSGSSWTEEELLRFVDRLDESTRKSATKERWYDAEGRTDA